MERELLELLVSNISSGINCQLFIENIIEIVTKYRNLGDYITDVTYSPIRKKINGEAGVAEYDPLNKKINIDLEAVESIIKESELTGSFALDRGMKIALRIQIMQYVLHELEHTNQNKIVDDESLKNKIEYKLIKASFDAREGNSPLIYNVTDEDILIEWLNKTEKNYKKFYKQNPVERFAQIKSYATIRNAFLTEKSSYDYFYWNIGILMYKEYLAGYDKTKLSSSCPTEIFLLNNGQEHIWTGFDFYSSDPTILRDKVNEKYDFAKRLYLGLPVSKKEYKEIDDVIKKE